jgi:DNA replication and repair protein RecF
MLLQSLRMVSFRAHEETAIEFAPGLNLLHGANGAGKTNVLEAIHYLCLTKSFLGSQDTHALRRGDSFFEVSGRFTGERRPTLDVRLAYVPAEGKRLFVNRAPLDRLADIVGMLPIVILAPEDYVLTAGGPEERRRFLDNTLSQSRPAYLGDLMRYRRALRQRNALLAGYRLPGGQDPAALEAWTAELVTLGARLIDQRHRFIARFSSYLALAFDRLEAVGEEPTMEYQSAFSIDPDTPEDAIRSAYHDELARLARRERERGRTLAGPHRDEVVFRLNGYEVRTYASQGQHRTFALALKLATFFYLRDILDETPLLLLDDVFGILDPRRSAIILELLQGSSIGQSILTAARYDPFTGNVPFEAPDHAAFLVASGRVGAARADAA